MSARPREWWSGKGARLRTGEVGASGVAAPVAPLPTVSRSPLRGVRWSLAFCATLLYIFVITTYKLGVADVAVLAGLAGIAMGRDRLRMPRPAIWLGALLLWSALGYVQSEYTDVVVTSLEVLLKLWLVFFVMLNGLRTLAQIRLFTLVALACFALFPARGALVNHFIYHEDVFGRVAWYELFANPNDLAAVALLYLGFATATLIVEPPGVSRLFALAGVVLLPLLLLLTQSRGAFLGLSVFAAFAALGVIRASRWSGKIQAVVALALVFVIAFSLVPPGAWERLGGLSKATDASNLEQVDAEGSARQRFEIWKVAMRIVRNHPLTGVGLGAYSHDHAANANRLEFDPTALGERDAHSTYLSVLAETGLPGLAIFLAMLFATASKAERVRRRVRGALPRSALQLLFLELGLLGYLVAGLFGSFAFSAFTYVYLAVLWATADAYDSNSTSVPAARYLTPIWRARSAYQR